MDSVSEFARPGNVSLSSLEPFSSLSFSLSLSLTLSFCLSSAARACVRAEDNADGTEVLLQAASARTSSSLLSDADSDESEPSNSAL